MNVSALKSDLAKGLAVAALDYAKRGWAVFPLHTIVNGHCTCGKADCSSPGKHPRTSNGVSDATTDFDQVKEWWGSWPDSNIGIAAGKSGLDFIDIDPKNGGNVNDLPLEADDLETITALTGLTESGERGKHCYYRHPKGIDIRQSSDKLPPGVDIRTGKGYVVAPPSLHQTGVCYEWTEGKSPDDIKPLPLPAALMPLLKVKDDAPPPSPHNPSMAAPRVDSEHPYVKTAFENELDELAATTVNRNDRLNLAAFSLGQFIGAGLLSRSEVESALYHTAIAIGLTKSETSGTLKSGIDSGIASPRDKWPDFSSNQLGSKTAVSSTSNGSDPAPVIEDQDPPPAAGLNDKEPAPESPSLEGLYQKALSAPDERKLAVLAQMTSDPSLSDPLVLDFWASKVKESGLCSVGAFKEAYRRNAPASGKTLVKSAEYINVLKSLGYDFRLNLCDDSLEINGERSSDPTRAKIRTQMRDAGYEQVNVIEDAYLAYATDKAYHPVREYFDSLKWDGQPHIAKFASHFIDKHNNAELWFRKWLIGAINRAFTGQQNPMLVLEGSQDLGKSYAARWLCPIKGYHHEGPIRADNKDHALRLIKRFIWEVGELEAVTTREDVAALKDFLTKEEVGERKAYGHDDTVKPALAVFIGTVNDNGAGFLRDTTGNRRFLVCSLVHINWDYAKLDVNQIWAEAVRAWRNGEGWRLTKAEAKKRDAINEQFMPEDPMEIRLNQHFYLDKSKNLVPATEAEQLVCSKKWWWVSSSDIYDKLQHYTKLANTEKGFYMSLANTMKRLGHEKHKVGKANGYVGVMVKPT